MDLHPVLEAGDWIEDRPTGHLDIAGDVDTAAAGDDVAFSTSLNRMRATSTSGKQIDLWTRATIGFRKIDGRWLVVHEHVSVPFYMDGSERAALDLEP